MYILGIDIGTQGSKGLLVSTAGEVVARLYQPVEVMRKERGEAEQDPEKAAPLAYARLGFAQLTAAAARAGLAGELPV